MKVAIKNTLLSRYTPSFLYVSSSSHGVICYMLSEAEICLRQPVFPEWFRGDGIVHESLATAAVLWNKAVSVGLTKYILQKVRKRVWKSLIILSSMRNKGRQWRGKFRTIKTFAGVESFDSQSHPSTMVTTTSTQLRCRQPKWQVTPEKYPWVGMWWRKERSGCCMWLYMNIS